MSAVTAEMETELEQELSHEGTPEMETSELAHELEAHEFEFELAHEHESPAEQEQEAFFNHLAAMADRGGRSQALRRIALAAGREALRAYRSEPPIVEGELEQSPGLAHELHTELNPVARAQGVTMMEHLAHEAASAETEQEAAEQFLPLIPLAAKAVLPLAAKALPIVTRRIAPTLIRRVAPQLARGVARVTRTLFRSPVTRPLIRTIPSIARGTVVNLARQAAGGRPVTPRTAIQTLARQTVRILSRPRMAANAFRRSRMLDQRYHRAARQIVGRPSYSPMAVSGGRRPVYRTGPPVTPAFVPQAAPVAQVPVVAIVPCPWHAQASWQSMRASR